MTNHYEAPENVEIGRAQDVILGQKPADTIDSLGDVGFQDGGVVDEDE